MTMSRRHFELIAMAVWESGIPMSDLRSVAVRLADRLAATNPRFDRERFIDACLRGPKN